MPGAQAAEIVMTTMCPLCYDEGRENPLRNRAGVFGQYCVGPDGGQPHFFDDTGTLRLLIKKMDEKRLLAQRRAAPVPPLALETMVAPPVEAEAPPSAANEPKAFEVTEVDAARLGELLGQSVSDSGTLVGAVFALKNNAASALTEDTRQLLTKDQLTTIRQRADGGLAIQIFLPWRGDPSTPRGINNPAWNLVDKSRFNGIPPTQFAQDLFENIASGNYFPPGELVPYPEVDPRSPGYWILISVPEVYVGSMTEKAAELQITPQQYLQNYFFWMMDNELFP